MKNLLEFLGRHYHWLLFVVLEAVSFVLLFQYNSYQSSVWFSSANAITGRVNEWRSFVESFFTLRETNKALMLRNFYLERQVNQLRRLYYERTDTISEQERRHLEFLSQYQPIAAQVIANETDRTDNLITIDRGEVDGVQVGMGVACGNGIVGVVYLTSAHHAVVISVLNSHSSRISCAIRGHGYFGVLRWYGEDAGYAYVEDIPRHARFKRGDWVETNGYSSIFPPGVLVGRIVEVYNSRDGLSYKLKVRLSTDFGTLRDVVVISDRSFAERMRLMQAARDSLQLNVRE
ncbi:MAG: rod shape-determining protein MreC [Prevotella sp.]|nr:rod shape-determining protein MreC [Prevotella sp.]